MYSVLFFFDFFIVIGLIWIIYKFGYSKGINGIFRKKLKLSFKKQVFEGWRKYSIQKCKVYALSYLCALNILINHISLFFDFYFVNILMAVIIELYILLLC